MKVNTLAFFSLTTTLGLLLTPAAHAVLLAYEGFNYSAGNVNGENGGIGWNSSWTASTNPVYATVVTGTLLNYAEGSISISGSGTALSTTGGGDGVLSRGFAGAEAGSEIYFSFLFQSVTGSGDEFAHFYLSEDANRLNSGGIGDFSTATGDAHFGARVNNGATDTTAASSISYTVGTTYLLVGRLSTDGTSGVAGEIDQVQLWVNPTSLTLGAADAIVDAPTGLPLQAFDVFSTRMVGFSAADQILIDELKIGTDVTSVISPVPEPSVAVLVLVGVALALHRKTRLQP